jgi:sterol desaturase/sphingolipid hydroxylase (fatty acid hydroxylase superfamily)
MNPIENLIKKFEMLGHQFLEPGSQMSVFALASAFCIAFGFLYLRQRKRRGKASALAILRALCSRRIVFNASTYADAGYFLVNTLALGGLVGWAALSTSTMASGVTRGLASLFGPSHPTHLPQWLARTVATIIFYLAYEFGYYVDHYLKHRVPFLWETHRPHHTAEVLTPLTLFRVHPLDTLIFGNVLALTAGPIAGLVNYAFGKSVLDFTLDGTNVLLVFFIYAYIHLQHSEIWIPFRGFAGRLFMSPAHHQIHHSMDRSHFNTNLGSCLAIWDWVFGTLSIPARQSPRLTFGVHGAGGKKHLPSGLLLEPIMRMARAILHVISPPKPKETAASELQCPSTATEGSRLAA